MPQQPQEWTIEFEGCFLKDLDCTCGVFQVRRGGGPGQRVEVTTTLQIEQMLAKEAGRQSFNQDEKALILAAAGRRLIEECIVAEGRVLPQLYLSGQIFRSRGAGRRLLRESGLMNG